MEISVHCVCNRSTLEGYFVITNITLSPSINDILISIKMVYNELMHRPNRFELSRGVLHSVTGVQCIF